MENPTVYLAAPWIHRASMVPVQDQFEAAGLEVTSRWIKLHPQTADPVQLRLQAEEDYDDVVSSDYFVLFNTAKSRGKETELGIALEAGCSVILVGPPEGNVFYHLPQVTQVESAEAAIAEILEREAE